MEKILSPETISMITEKGIEYGTKLIGAIILFIVGKWLIGLVERIVSKALDSKKVDSTLSKYAQTIIGGLLYIILIVSILGYFGVETTSFAAVLAAGGLAIGMAWSGLLANFAAGVFLIILRPFKVGDFISAGGQLGTVKEVGMFVTIIDTMDNVKTIIGNNKIFSDTIQNFTANPFRRVDLVAQLNHGVNPVEAAEKLKAALKKIPNIAAQEADVHVLEFNLAGPVLCVRPYVHNDHYWDVYFATNMAITETFGAAGYPIPEQHYHIRKNA